MLIPRIPLVDRATEWMDQFWDPTQRMLTYPSRAGSKTNPYQQPGVPIVRETANYALGLLLRDGAGDGERATSAIDEVLRYQIDDPTSVCHGTWRRSPLEPEPGPQPREWLDYDPNWREFVGTALILALEHFEAALPRELVARILHALRLATTGAVTRAVPAEYTNIALLSAFLLDWVGNRLDEPEWSRRAEELGREVADAYRATGAFPEHNSPTYYGIDLYGAALWREHAVSLLLRDLGREMEAALWRDLARFYHAGMRNFCGPYSRAYGMDMNRYVGCVGIWFAAGVDAAPPLPEFGDDVTHAHDFGSLPWVGLLGSRPPDDVRPILEAFPGEHRIEQIITREPRRVATAWLSEHVMIGGEYTSARMVHWQHHPATVHWCISSESDAAAGPDVGWLRLVTTVPVDAVAEPGRLLITVHTGLEWLRTASIPIWIETHPAPTPEMVLEDGAVWNLPGARIRVSVRGAGSPTREVESEADCGRVGFDFDPGQAPETVEITLGFESV